MEQEDLEPGEPPPGLEYIWDVFLDLHSSRQVGFGPSPISYGDIQAWCQLNQIALKAWQVDTIKRLDRAYLKTASDKDRRKSQEVKDQAANPPKGGRPPGA